MGPRNYWATFRRNWIVIVLATLLGGGGAIIVSSNTVPLYSATSSLYFAINFGSSANDLNAGSAYTQGQMLSFAILATTPSVLDPAIDQLKLQTDAGTLASTIVVTRPQDTVILQIAATSPSPIEAANIANAVVTNLQSQVEQNSPKDLKGLSTVTARVIDAATAPTAPSSPNLRLNLLAGILLGLIAGILLALLRDVLDRRLRTASDISSMTEKPIVGAIERDPKTTDGGLVILRDPLSPSAESFRALRTNLQFVVLDNPNLAVVITSALPAEGKSTVASNLALALAESEKRVLLVDADLRRPTVASYAGINGAVGLTTVLIGRASFDDVVQQGGHPSLHILPAGEIPPNPSQMLSSRAMANLIADLRTRYDVVVIDAAPLLAVPDAVLMSQIVDGVLIVADTTKIRRPQLARALSDLERSGTVLLGIVLNRVPRRQNRPSYYGVRPSDIGVSKRDRELRSRPSGPGLPIPHRSRPVVVEVISASKSPDGALDGHAVSAEPIRPAPVRREPGTRRRFTATKSPTDSTSTDTIDRTE